MNNTRISFLVAAAALSSTAVWGQGSLSRNESLQEIFSTAEGPGEARVIKQWERPKAPAGLSPYQPVWQEGQGWDSDTKRVVIDLNPGDDIIEPEAEEIDAVAEVVDPPKPAFLRGRTQSPTPTPAPVEREPEPDVPVQASFQRPEDRLTSYPFEPYFRGDKRPMPVGAGLESMGERMVVVRREFKDNALLRQYAEGSLRIPVPKSPKNTVVNLREGASSFPRSFVPFEDMYGPGSHRVQATPFEIGDLRGDYSIGVLSDYDTTFVSVVVNIEVADGMYYVVRLGSRHPDSKELDLKEIEKQVHRYLDGVYVDRG